MVNIEHQNREISSNIPYVWVKKEAYSWKEPILLPGCQYLEGTPETGYVIQNQNTGSEYVAVPVQCLPQNGTLDGITYNARYGRRYFNKDVDGFYMKNIVKSVNKTVYRSIHKYKLFYISRYMASKDHMGNIIFVNGSMPFTVKELYRTNVHLETFLESADRMNKEMVHSYLPSGEAYDSLCAAIIYFNSQTYREIAVNSTELGNYWHSPNSPRKLMPNGSVENGYVFNINGLAGNFGELTSERHGNFYIWRGNYFGYGGGAIASRHLTSYDGKDYIDQTPYIGCRAIMCLNP